MRVQLSKWGNSTGLRVPAAIMDKLGLKAGGQVELSIEGQDLLVRPIRGNARQWLADMVVEARRLGPDFEPDTVDWGPDAGSEIINDDDPR